MTFQQVPSPVQAPVPSAQYQPSPPQSLGCQDCGMVFTGAEEIGFCSRCGAALCPNCSRNRMAYRSSESSSRYYVVVTTTQTSTLTLGLTICRSCKKEIDAKQVAGLKKTLVGCVVVFLVFFLGLTIPNRFADVEFPFCFGALVAVLVGILLYVLLVERAKKGVVPHCPVCGADMTGVFHNMFKGRTGRQALPNYVVCPTCGYQGQLSPLEGLFMFVDKNGPGPLQVLPIGPLAYHSFQVRQSLRK